VDSLERLERFELSFHSLEGCCPAIGRQSLGPSGEIRTHNLQVRSLLHVSIVLHPVGVPPEIRTLTVQGLSLIPLPIGIEGHGWSGRIRTYGALVNSQSPYLLGYTPVVGREGFEPSLGSV
jgi:hypothetical protein